MNYATPESKGILSSNILKYIDILENARLSTHDIIIARGEDIIFEKYWEPFHKDFLHRLYSVTKSIVAIAIGFVEQDGLVDLDKSILDYFTEYEKYVTDDYMRVQTVKDMLMMCTVKYPLNWFAERSDDRVRTYFENNFEEHRPAGTIFSYDSSGSFVLCALVERLVGMPFMDYLRIKLFDKIGVSKEAYCLKCPGGHSWGDSAVLCTAQDLLKIARFTMNLGSWNGEQILNKEYMKTAVSKLVDNDALNVNTFDSQGYGYQIWRTFDNSFFFNGMGCQLAICVPDKDIIMIYNGDNQGISEAKSIICNNFFDLISRPAVDFPLEEDKISFELLEKREYKLMTAKGEYYSNYQNIINSKTFIFDNNPMGITKCSLEFTDDICKFNYTNAQGDKTLLFGLGKNVYSKFPQEGYSDEIGSVYEKGHYYDCGVSAAWLEPKKLFLKVQVIDKYFGRLNITISFKDENTVGIYMQKTAEDFFDEYVGFASGKAE